MKICGLIRFDDKGLIPAIIQDEKSKKVLTLCYMNKEALDKTLQEGKIHVFRRSKGKLMMKGESSGHIQVLKELYIDCEGNSLLFLIDQRVAGCHAGYFSCYYRKVNEKGELEITEKVVFNPKDAYKA